MSVPRWERERAAWLMVRSQPGGTLRRRAEILGRRARRDQRAGAGVAVTASQDEVTPNLWRRLTRDPSSGERGRRVRYGLAAVLVAALVGPGLALGYGIYRVLLRLSPRIGRLWVWPWAAVAAAWFVALLVTGTPFGVSLHLDERFPLSLISVGPWWAWAAWQVAVALVMTAWEVFAWGWPGVAAGAKPKPERDRNGNFRVTPDDEKYRLAVEAMTPAPAAPKVLRRRPVEQVPTTGPDQ